MKRLLIAEQSEIIATELADALQDQWEILTCGSGDEAIRLLKCWRPDGLIIDLGLPEKNGFEVLAECFPDLPPAIVALGTVVNQFVEQFVVRWGVDYLFELPFETAKVKLAMDETALQKIPAKNAAQHLRVLGYRAGLDGYMCLLTAVPYILEDPARKLGKEVYVHVAEVCGMTDDRDVERAIRFATKDAWKRRNVKMWTKYFPCNETGDVDRPKNKDVIRCLLQKVQ